MRHLLPLLTLLILSVSCADDLSRRDIFATTSEQVVMSFSVDKVTLSRAEEGTSFDEGAIHHAYLLFYPSDNSDFTGSPVAVVKATVPETGKLRFKMPADLQENTSYKLVAVANADAYTPSGFDDFEAYLKSLNEIPSLSAILLHCSRSITSSSVSCLPMKGTVKDDSSFSFSRNGGVVYVNVSLSFRRLVSRIDVSNIADNFTLEGVALCNWRDAVSLGNPDSQPGDIKGILSASEASEDNCLSPSEGSTSLDGALYCFPSSNDSPAPGDQKTTAIIIKGKYNNGASSYYRVNLGLNDDGSKLEANTKYTVSITAVNGDGYASAAAAYEAISEPQIVTATVEDWDIEGGNYVMDDDGHVLGVSKTALEFASDDTQAQEIKVLCSKDLSLSAEFIAAEGTPEDSFNMSLEPTSSISIFTLKISPKTTNTSTTRRSGICRITASKDGITPLPYEVRLNQLPSADQPYVPEIPDLPVALIPLENKHLISINHTDHEIVIDGFDPNCVNSFIDIPLMVFIRDSIPTKTVRVTSAGSSYDNGLDWPLEGRLSDKPSAEYCYCPDSYKDGSVLEIKTSKPFAKTSMQGQGTNGGISCTHRKIIYLSVGAMAPDDPQIEREITLDKLTDDNNVYKYTLKIKPKDIIIDDVILSDESDHSWLIFDRNLQNPTDTKAKRQENGSKLQAYNFVSSNPAFNIPFKKKDESGTPFNEAYHTSYMGKYISYSQRTTIASTISSWLDNYMYESTISPDSITSPFYKNGDKGKWQIPGSDVLDLCKSKMKVSKMRLFLMSDVPAVKDGKEMPICCYWPFYSNFNSMGDTSQNTYGYYISNSSGEPSAIVQVYCDKTDVKTNQVTSGCTGLTRLVRQLSPQDLENYKTNYLGYGTNGCRLKKCHPDTYNKVWTPQ